MSCQHCIMFLFYFLFHMGMRQTVTPSVQRCFWSHKCYVFLHIIKVLHLFNWYFCLMSIFLLLPRRTTHFAVPASSAKSQIIREILWGPQRSVPMCHTSTLQCGRCLWADRAGPGDGLSHLWTVVVEWRLFWRKRWSTFSWQKDFCMC